MPPLTSIDQARLPPAQSRRALIWVIGLLTGTVYLAIAAFQVAYGPMNVDEGFYAAAARGVWQGEMPYRDFGFTQPPLVAYANAPMLGIVGFGLFEQRAVNGLWGLAALLLGARLVVRRGGAAPATLFVALFALCPAWMCYVQLGKTYGLTSLLAMVATAVFIGIKPGWQRCVALSLMVVLGVGCRLPAAPFFGVLWIAALWENGAVRLRLIAVAVISLVVLAATLLLPFYLSAPEQTKFWILDFHRVSVPLKDWRLSWNQVVGLAPAIWLLATGAIITAIMARRWRTPEISVIAASGLALAVNLLPRGVYDEYGVPFLPSLAVGSFLLLAPLFSTWSRGKSWALGSALLLTPFAIIPAVNWSRLATVQRTFPSVWLPTNTPPYNFNLPRNLQNARGNIEHLLPPGEPFIGPNIILAIETGHPIPRTMRMGAFSFSADFDPEKANRLHLLTHAEFEKHLRDFDVRLLGMHTKRSFNYVWSVPSFNAQSDEALQRWGELLGRYFVLVYADQDFEILARPHLLPP